MNNLKKIKLSSLLKKDKKKPFKKTLYQYRINFLKKLSKEKNKFRKLFKCKNK